MTLELPPGYAWGYARRERYTTHPRRHIVDKDVQLICTGGRALVGETPGAACPACRTWLREWWAES